MAKLFDRDRKPFFFHGLSSSLARSVTHAASNLDLNQYPRESERVKVFHSLNQRLTAPRTHTHNSAHLLFCICTLFSLFFATQPLYTRPAAAISLAAHYVSPIVFSFCLFFFFLSCRPFSRFAYNGAVAAAAGMGARQVCISPH